MEKPRIIQTRLKMRNFRNFQKEAREKHLLVHRDENYKVLHKSGFTKVITRFIPIKGKYFSPKTVVNITLREVLGKNKNNMQLCAFKKSLQNSQNVS